MPFRKYIRFNLLQCALHQVAAENSPRKLCNTGYGPVLVTPYFCKWQKLKHDCKKVCQNLQFHLVLTHNLDCWLAIESPQIYLCHGDKCIGWIKGVKPPAAQCNREHQHIAVRGPPTTYRPLRILCRIPEVPNFTTPSAWWVVVQSRKGKKRSKQRLVLGQHILRGSYCMPEHKSKDV